MPSEEFKKKVETLILLRLFFISLLLGAIFFFDFQGKQFYQPYIFYGLSFAGYVPSLLYIFLQKRVAGNMTLHRLSAYVLLALDVLTVVFLILITGGIESWFSFLLILVTIASSIVLGRRAGYIMATLASILYGLAVDLQYYRVIPVDFNPVLEEKDFFYNIFINISGLYLTAFLMGYLVSRLEKTSEKLQKKDVDLKELYRFHSEVIENIPSGLFSLDTSGRIVLFNSAAERITGLRRDSVTFRYSNEIFPFLTLPPKTGRHEGEIMRNSEKRYVGVSISVNKSSEGEILGYIGTFQDLTDIVKMEEEIKRREKLAAIGELSASIAHELRNPIASMKGSFEMLKENVLPEETKKRLMDIAISEMDRLNDIVTDFLLYCNPKPPEMKRFSLSAAANEVADMLGNMTDKIRIVKDIQDGILIVADEQKIRQLLWNLTMNAVEAITGEGEVVISLYSCDGSAVLKVSDSGSGIDEENLEKIFILSLLQYQAEGNRSGAFHSIQDRRGTSWQHRDLLGEGQGDRVCRLSAFRRDRRADERGLGGSGGRISSEERIWIKGRRKRYS
ncbi:MAG: PAS domain S-box protein [Nitrospirae bacterium]|nr:PAS domain S-box protein [Nitrospirota bacterium]